MIRLLPKDEYHRLPEGYAPKFGSVWVAEEGDEIVGVAICQEQLHVEPVWVKEELRGSPLAFNLWKRAMQSAGNNPIYCSTVVEPVQQLLLRLGFKPLGVAFVREQNGKRSE